MKILRKYGIKYLKVGRERFLIDTTSLDDSASDTRDEVGSLRRSG